MYGCRQCTISKRSFLTAGALALIGAGLPRHAVAAPGSGSPAAMSGAAAQDSSPGDADKAVGGGRIVDFHTHLYDETLPSIIPLSMDATHGQAWLNAMRSPALHVEHMDRCGVDAHVISYSNAVHGISWGDGPRDLEVYRGINDRIASEWVATHPGRFLGAFSLPTQDLRLAIPELQRAVEQLGLKVLQVSSCTAQGVYYGDPSLDPLWEAVQHFGVTVFIHPHGQDSKPPFDGFALNNSVGQGVEEVKVMTSIIYNGVFEKFPDLKIVVAHGGGFLPHYYGRMDRNAKERPWTVRNIKKLPSEYLKSFYYDSCVYGPEILASLIRVVGVDRIVLGTDYPVGEADGFASLRQTPGLSPADVATIARETPSRLLGLVAPRAA